MEKQFVTYEIALKLKELGFNEICCARYDTVGDSVFFQQHVLVETQQDFSWQLCSAPLWQQSIDWCLNKIESRNIEPHNRRWRIEYYANGDGCIDFGEGDYCSEFKTLKEAVEILIKLIK